MRHSLSWKERIVFFGIFEVFLSQCGHNWCKNLKFQNTLKNTLKKWPFDSQVYTKNIKEHFSECKEFKNWFICIISEIQGVQEFQIFLRCPGTGLFALSQSILKIFFIENYSNLITLNQHSTSSFAQQPKKQDAYIQNLTNLLFDYH